LRFFFALLLFVLPSIGFSQAITEYAVPTAAPTDLYGITKGPDGAVWFGESRKAKIGRVAPDGSITEFPTAGGSPPYQLATGPDGNIWFVDGGSIGRMTLAGQVTYFQGASDGMGGFGNPQDITAGPEDALWYADGVGRIGKITAAGVVTIFPLPPSQHVGAYPYTIAAGPDGNLWFTDGDNQEIERMTPTGVLTDFPVTGFRPYDITPGPDGAMWFTLQPANGGGPGTIGRITTAGVVRTFPLSMGAWLITAGPDGNLWFTDLSGAIGRITPDGVVTRFPLSSQSAAPIAIATGADGNIWFTETGANKIGRLEPGSSGPPLCVTDDHTLCLNNNRFAVNASYQQTPLGPSIAATAVRLTADTGYFWFFDPNNVELVTKVLNGCGSNDAYWVFAAGLTNLGVNLTVRDLQSGVLMKTYDNPVGTPFAPIQDTGAFRTCP